MMRGKYNWSVAVREPDGGIYVEEHDLASGRAKNGWLHWPLVRGCRAMAESLVLGYKALEIAALHAFAEEPESGNAEGAGEVGSSDSPARSDSPLDCPARAELATDPPAPSARPMSGSLAATGGASSRALGPRLAEEGEEGGFSWKDDFGRPDVVIDALGAQARLEVVEGPEAAVGPEADAVAAPEGEDGEPEFGKREMAVSMVLGLVLGVALFIVAPAALTNLVVGEYDANPVLWNIVDGVLRVGVFVFYLWLIGRMSDIKRMFGYHGAEHKTIHCYEHGLPLTPENARSFPRLHVRCGTAFLIMVMIIAIFVYTVVPLNALIGAWGVPDGAPKLALVIAVAHPAHARHRRHLVRDHGEVGRQPSGQPAGQVGAVARHADAVPHHQRTRRRADRVRHRRHAEGARARGGRGREGESGFERAGNRGRERRRGRAGFGNRLIGTLCGFARSRPAFSLVKLP